MERTISDAQFAEVYVPDNIALVNTLSTGGMSVYMGAPVLADVDRIVTTVNWPTGALTCSIAAQPDVPRNITITLSDADNSCTGTLTITGLDPVGRVVTEVLTPNVVAGAGKTLTGTKIFAKVTSAVVAGGAGSTPDAFTIGVGNVIGVPMDLSWDASVITVFLGAVLVTTRTVSTGVSLSGIDINAATYDGSKVMWAIINPIKRA